MSGWGSLYSEAQMIKSTPSSSRPTSPLEVLDQSPWRSGPTHSPPAPPPPSSLPQPPHRRGRRLQSQFQVPNLVEISLRSEAPGRLQDVWRGGGERRGAQDRRRVPQGQVPDELRGGDHPGAQVRADPAALVGVGPVVAGVAGVREVAAVREALQPLQEPRRRAPGPRDAQPLRTRRVRALHARQPLPRHQRRGHRARPVPQVRRQVRRRRQGREDREDAQRPLPHQEVRVE